MRKIKLLVWDLDETLWDGVWLYDREEVKIKKGIHMILKRLDWRGILQTIVSKNVDFEDIMAFLEKQGLRQYFIYPQLNMQPKSQNIRTVVETLGLSRYDEVAFIDDEAFELKEVSTVFPDIMIINACNYDSLTEWKRFTPEVVTEEDHNRRLMVLQDEKRQVQAKAYGEDYQKFLMSLNMRATIRPLRKDDISRVVQLSERTNRWNSNTKILTEKHLQEILAHLHGDEECWVCVLEDDIGSYGIVGYKLQTMGCLSGEIEDMTFSCRVAGRGLGSCLVVHTMQQAYNRGMNEISATFCETKYNGQLHNLYTFLGFEKRYAREDYFEYSWTPVADVPKYPPWLKVEVKE